MPTVKTNYHSTLAFYFQSKPLYLDEPTRKKPNTRKLVEQPWQQTKGEMWDEVTDTLCDLYFIEAKCINEMIFDLIGDFIYALQFFPENQIEIDEEKQRKKRIDKWTKEILDYSKEWSELRYKQSPGEIINEPEAQLPKPPPLCRIRKNEEIEKESLRIVTNPSRLDRINAFKNFLTSQCYTLIKFRKQPNFILQHAYNYASAGSVHMEAKHRLDSISGPVLIRLWPSEAIYNPLPALLRTLEGHSKSVRCVCITSDGQRAVSTSIDDTIRVWDLETGACLHTLKGKTNGIISVSITPDGQKAVTANNDFSIGVWDLKNGICLDILKGSPKWVESVSITPDGQLAVSACGDSTIRVWDLNTGACRHILEGHRNNYPVNCVSVTPDGRRAVSGGNDSEVRVWDLETGKCLQTLEGHDRPVRSVSITPDGYRVVSGDDIKEIKVWDLKTGKCLRSLNCRATCLSITPDGLLAVSVGQQNKTFAVWDLEMGVCIRELEGHSDRINSVSITPDGRRAVSASGDDTFGKNDNTIRVWNLETGISQHNLEEYTGDVIALSAAPNGLRAVSAAHNAGKLRVWSMESGRFMRNLEGFYDFSWSVCITPDGKQVIAQSGEGLRVWDLETGAYLSTLKLSLSQVNRIALTPTGRTIALTGGGESFQVWSLESSSFMWEGKGNEEQREVVCSINFTPDGCKVISGGESGTLRVWDVKTGACLHTLKGQSGSIWSVCVTPDGRSAISASYDRTLCMWDLESGVLLHVLKSHKSIISTVSITPDGRRAISSGGHHDEDSTIRIWDLVTGTCLRILEGHSYEVANSYLTLDGRLVVSGSKDKTLRVWDSETGERLAIASGDADWSVLARVSFSKIIAGSSTGEVAVFDLRNLIFGPAVTTIHEIREAHKIHNQELSADCPLCGHRFAPPTTVLTTIEKITKKAGLKPEQSPCMELPDEAWEDPRLLGNCPKCNEKLKFNPFIAGDYKPKQTWKFWKR